MSKFNHIIIIQDRAIFVKIWITTVIDLEIPKELNIYNLLYYLVKF